MYKYMNINTYSWSEIPILLAAKINTLSFSAIDFDLNNNLMRECIDKYFAEKRI